MTNLMVKTTSSTLLTLELDFQYVQPEHCAAFNVCRKLREVYIFAVKKYTGPVFHLDYADITTQMFLDKITGPFDFPSSALDLRIKLYIKVKGAALNISDDELSLLPAFIQKFTHPNLVIVEWYNQHDVGNRHQIP
jgi:hypothetical protein